MHKRWEISPEYQRYANWIEYVQKALIQGNPEKLRVDWIDVSLWIETNEVERVNMYFVLSPSEIGQNVFPPLEILVGESH